MTWRALSISPYMLAWCYGTLQLPMLPDDDSDSDAEEANRHSTGEQSYEEPPRDDYDSDAEEGYRYSMGTQSEEELPSDDSDSDAEEAYRYSYSAGRDRHSMGRGSHSSTSQLNVSTFCGTRLVPSLDMWVITRHKLDTQRLTNQTGLG